jgi:homoserine dehydrogenase
MEKLTIGLLGFGVVGEGLYQVLQQADQNVHVRQIAIKNRNKIRNAPDEMFTAVAEQIVEHPEIELIVELINDADAAFELVKKALSIGKSVVTANKKMLAEHLPELLQIQAKTGAKLLYEAAVCGSIPIVRNLETCLQADQLHSLSGIVNGSCNFILSNMQLQHEEYSKTLYNAQQNGFAESDPTLDVEGYDSAYKLSILTLHTFGYWLTPERISRRGISAIHPADLRFAEHEGNKVKLLARCWTNSTNSITASVIPTFVAQNSALGGVDQEFNAVLTHGELTNEQFFSGKGAGRYPTTSAVLSDIAAYREKYRYSYHKVPNPFYPDTATLVNRSLKCYIGYPPDRSPNLDFLETIDVQYFGKERNYCIGHTTLEALTASGCWSQPEVAIIEYF